MQYTKIFDIFPPLAQDDTTKTANDFMKLKEAE